MYVFFVSFTSIKTIIYYIYIYMMCRDLGNIWKSFGMYARIRIVSNCVVARFEKSVCILKMDILIILIIISRYLCIFKGRWSVRGRSSRSWMHNWSWIRIIYDTECFFPFLIQSLNLMMSCRPFAWRRVRRGSLILRRKNLRWSFILWCIRNNRSCKY